MTFVLSVIRPPANGAAFGKAMTQAGLRNPVEIGGAVRAYLRVLGTDVGHLDDNDRFASQVGNADFGVPHEHSETCLTFRTDPATDAPHPCRCCSRLVLPTDHEQAGLDDAYCLGCFTWDRNVGSCLPANSAHSEG